MFNGESILSINSNVLNFIANLLPVEMKKSDDTTIRLNQIRHNLIRIESKIVEYIEKSIAQIDDFKDQEDMNNFLKLKNIFDRYNKMKEQNYSFFNKTFSMHEKYIENEKDKYTVNNFNELFNEHSKLSLDSSSMNIIVITSMISFLKKIRHNSRISSDNSSVDEFNKFKDYVFKADTSNYKQTLEISISSKG